MNFNTILLVLMLVVVLWSLRILIRGSERDNNEFSELDEYEDIATDQQQNRTFSLHHFVSFAQSTYDAVLYLNEQIAWLYDTEAPETPKLGEFRPNAGGTYVFRSKGVGCLSSLQDGILSFQLDMPFGNKNSGVKESHTWLISIAGPLTPRDKRVIREVAKWKHQGYWNAGSEQPSFTFEPPTPIAN